MSELTNDEKLAMAFPLPAVCGYHSHVTGMTLLDHFAGLAMQEFIGTGLLSDTIAEHSYEMAEAMMISRRKYEVKE